MANDWKTVYGEDVVKTNKLHRLQDPAEDIVPIDCYSLHSKRRFEA